MIPAVTRLRRLFALWLSACGATPDGHVRLAGAARRRAATGRRRRRFAGPPPRAASSALLWQTGPQVGHGVAFKDTKNPAGENLFIGYAGYRVSLASAEAWVEALHEASLAARDPVGNGTPPTLTSQLDPLGH
jgi:hypothetical protein